MFTIITRIFLVSLPCVITFLFLSSYRKRALKAMHLSSSPIREVGLVLYAIVLSSIVALKLWPTYCHEPSPGIWGNTILLIERPAKDTLVNLKPFSMFKDYYSFYSTYGSANLFDILFNFSCNFIAFVPVGLLTSLLFRKTTWKTTIGIGFTLSCITEIGQYFIMRNTSIDDLFLNTLGTLCGYLMFVLLKNKAPKFSAKFRCQEKQSSQN